MNYSPLFRRLLVARGINSAEADAFLRPAYDQLSSPKALPDITKAVKRIKQAIQQREPILVFGDYDADGITATALLVRALRQLGAVVEYDLPERASDGYGLPQRLLDALAKRPQLLITVDCGSANGAIIAQLAKQGVDVIVTDHHEIPKLPPALAVVNPKRADSQYPNRDLAGVGVAFQLVRALDDGAWTKWLLDLVALGTVCDQVPLHGDNRILVQYGLQVLPASKWRGLRELIRGINQLDVHSLAFYLGPRLNASGRLNSPRQALELLLTDDAMQASTIALRLHELNEQRRTIQDQALAKLQVKTDASPIVVRGDWPEGIIGLLASKLVEQHTKPAFVFTNTADGQLKGSARSFGEFSCAKAIAHLRKLGLATKGGGHAAAGGLTIKATDFAAVARALEQYYRSLQLTDQARFLAGQPDLVLEDSRELTLDFWRELALLAPFGQGNTEPIFRLHGQLMSSRRIGRKQEHLALQIVDRAQHTFEICAWNGASRHPNLELHGTYQCDFHLAFSDWGQPHLEGRLLQLTSLDHWSHD